MTVIKQEDLIQSIADSLQYISYYHPLDYIQALGRAYGLEESPAAWDAIAQILTNSRMCAEGKRPICQDTGIVTVFVKVGMDVRWDGATMGVTDMINEGVRRGEASAPARSLAQEVAYSLRVVGGTEGVCRGLRSRSVPGPGQPRGGRGSLAPVPLHRATGRRSPRTKSRVFSLRQSRMFPRDARTRGTFSMGCAASVTAMSP
jgi:hypothetical protein